jgi:acetyl-CoA carboxylase carboxyl transferase subunit beta
MLCESWVELRSVDPVVRAALATFAGQRVVVIAHDRRAGAGRPAPGGLRLAQRAVALAGRLGLPVVTFIDTPGAEPGAAAEADAVAREIASTFGAMADLRSPSVAVCVGEGGSGGALAFGHADRLLILEHAIFSVIGPEGAAAILERDVDKAPAVAERLKLTSADLKNLGIVDAVVPETHTAIATAVAAALDTASPGDRLKRTDAATARWLHE